MTSPTSALRDALRGRWRDALPRCLDELAETARGRAPPAALIDTISLRRKEIDEVLRVAVLGEFSAGKSTFVNALVGREVSPMGVLPTTASVHWLRFGDPLARVLDARGAVTECAVGDAAAVVRRRRREGVATERVEVTLPLPRLASVELIDTPGFNAGDDEHERAGRAAMALADLALWLFDARQAGKDSERGPLRSARAEALPVLGVLNKCDHLDAAGLAQVLAVLGDRARRARALRRGGVVARAALKAASEGAEDPSWARFERWLAREVTDRRDRWKRARVARRASRDILAARAALDGHAGRRGDASRRARALLAELDGLRDALRDAVAQARKELAPALADQSRAPRGASPEDAAALLDDAAAETVWRATRAAMRRAAPAPRRGGAPRGARRGAARATRRELVSAPVGVWLELAVRDAARDATESRGDLARESGRWLAARAPRGGPARGAARPPRPRRRGRRDARRGHRARARAGGRRGGVRALRRAAPGARGNVGCNDSAEGIGSRPPAGREEIRRWSSSSSSSSRRSSS